MTARRQPARPLEGRTVMVTRAEGHAEPLAELLEARGAVPIVAPAIEIVPAGAEVLDPAIDELAARRFDWVAFTSRTGVESFVGRLHARGMDGGVVDASAAAVGDGTAQALIDAGIPVALVPDEFTTAALANAMPTSSGRVLLFRADIAGDDLESALAEKGWTPVRVNAYRTKFPGRLPPEAASALRDGRVDAITFTSASTVRGFVEMLDSATPMPNSPPKVVCIGPVTADAARDAGFVVDSVARPHTIEGLLSALESLFALVKE
jgi:uroporphyrinogen-III synthase